MGATAKTPRPSKQIKEFLLTDNKNQQLDVFVYVGAV